MSKVRVRITPKYLDGMSVAYTYVKAQIVKSMHSGTLDKCYINERAWKEMVENGYAYINVRKEFIV